MIERIRNLTRNLPSYHEYPIREEAEKLSIIGIKRHKYAPNTHLTVLGVHHRREPDDPQIATMRDAFESWLDKTEGTKRTILVEGRIPDVKSFKKIKSLTEREEAAIRSERSEMALLALWADEHGIELESAERQPFWSEAHNVATAMKNNEEVKKKGLSGQDVTAYYYVARQMPQAEKSGKDIKTYIQDTMDGLQKKWKWQDFAFTYDNFISIHNALYGIPFDHKNEQFFLEQTGNWHANSTLVQKVAGMVRNARDEHLANTLTENWDRGVSVFCAFGRNHVWRNEEILSGLGLPDK